MNNVSKYSTLYLDGTSALKPQQDSTPTLADFITNTWIPLAVEDGEHKASTVDFYHSMCQRIVKFFPATPINKVTGLDIDSFIKHLRLERNEGKSLSPASIRHHFNTLNTVFQYAYKHEIIAKNPCVTATKPKNPVKSVDALSPKEVREFIKSAEDCPLDFRCMLLLLLSTGIRRGECMGLQWQDIDFVNKRLHIQRIVTRPTKGDISIGTPKSANSVRFIPLSDKMCALLEEYRKSMGENQNADLNKAFLFPGRTSIFVPRDPTSVTRKVKSFMKRSGLPDYSPHDIRHTAASQLFANGADPKSVQNILGHSNPSTTLKFYAKADLEQMQKAADKFTSAFDL